MLPLWDDTRANRVACTYVNVSMKFEPVFYCGGLADSTSHPLSDVETIINNGLKAQAIN